MLPYLAASGHNHYTKCVWIYLQQMSKLEDDNPTLYRHFIQGLHVVPLKTTGGLTRGRGMTEQQRLTWVMAMPACAEINKIMQDVTGKNYNSGEQNKDMSVTIGKTEIGKTLTQSSGILVIETPSPLTLVCITFQLECMHIVQLMLTRQKLLGKPFRRKNQAVTMDTKSSIRIDGNTVQIDPQLLFQRLALAAKATYDLEAVFKYELCSYPPAVFESPLLLRQAQKPVLADALWSLLQTPNIPAISGQVQYVLDGGALIQRIPWKKGATYSEILGIYTEYVTRKYGHAIVVFDGYLNSSTKDMTHQRRLKSKIGATVTFTEKMHLTMTKSEFLMNKINKQRFVNMLGETLEKNNCKSYYASADADLLMPIYSFITMKTVLVGDAITQV